MIVKKSFILIYIVRKKIMVIAKQEKTPFNHFIDEDEDEDNNIYYLFPINAKIIEVNVIKYKMKILQNLLFHPN